MLGISRENAISERIRQEYKMLILVLSLKYVNLAVSCVLRKAIVYLTCLNHLLHCKFKGFVVILTTSAHLVIFALVLVEI